MVGPSTSVVGVKASVGRGERAGRANVVDYAKRFHIPLIAITGRADSALAQAADVALVLPASDEASPMGLAPTTSTTVMLALGDAIAIALLERKGFSPDRFHALHPGGRLGRTLLKVADLMHRGEEVPLTGGDTAMADALLVMTRAPKTIGADALASEAVGLMNENAITNLFVVEDGRPVGILHIHDCLRAGVA